MLGIPPGVSDTENSKPGCSGFTLIEAILAMAIVSLALLPMVEAYTLMFRTSLDASKRNTATILAQECIQTLTDQVPYQDLDGSTACVPTEPYGQFGDPYSEYSYQTNVNTISTGDSQIDVSEIQLRVEYPSLTGGSTKCITSPDCSDWDLVVFRTCRQAPCQ